MSALTEVERVSESFEFLPDFAGTIEQRRLPRPGTTDSTSKLWGIELTADVRFELDFGGWNLDSATRLHVFPFFVVFLNMRPQAESLMGYRSARRGNPYSINVKKTLRDDGFFVYERQSTRFNAVIGGRDISPVEVFHGGTAGWDYEPYESLSENFELVMSASFKVLAFRQTAPGVYPLIPVPVDGAVSTSINADIVWRFMHSTEVEPPARVSGMSDIKTLEMVSEALSDWHDTLMTRYLMGEDDWNSQRINVINGYLNQHFGLNPQLPTDLPPIVV